MQNTATFLLKLAHYFGLTLSGLNYVLNFTLKSSNCITFGEKAFLPLESQELSLR